MENSNINILIVDDDANLRTSLTDIINFKGFTAIPLRKGGEALRRVEQGGIAVALVDLRLEDMSGLKVIQAIKQTSPDTECILLTGHASQTTAIEATNQHVFAYFEKPHDVDQLLLSIHRAVEKRQTDQALLESEKRFRALIENNSDVITLLDDQFHILYHSPSMTAVLLYSVEERIGKSGFENVHPDDLKGIRDLLVPQILNTPRRPFPIEIRLRNKQGNYRWIGGTMVNLLDEPAVRAIVFNSRDITERKLSEEKLRVQNTALEASANAMMITSRDGTIEWVNPAFTQMTGYSFDEALGKNPRDLLKSGAHGVDFYKQLWDEILCGKIWRSEIINRRKDGSLYQEEMSITPLVDQAGEVIRFIAVKQDISERKHAEIEIKRRVNELEVLYDNGLSINGIYEPHEIAQCIINVLSKKMAWYHAAVWLYHPETNFVELLALNAPQMILNDEPNFVDVQKVIQNPDDGLTGWVIRHGQPLRLADIRSDPRAIICFSGIQSGLYVPIKAGEVIIGCISIESDQQGFFDEHDERLLTTLAAQAAVAFENAHNFIETRLWASQLVLLVQTGRNLAETLNQAEIFQRLNEAFFQLVPNICCLYILLYDETHQVINCVSASRNKAFLDVTGLPALPFDSNGKDYLSQVIITGHPAMVDDPDEAGSGLKNLLSIDSNCPSKSSIFIPMITQNRIIGLILAQSEIASAFRGSVELMILVGDTAAISIENARLYQSSQQELAERQRAEAELRLLNLELEQRVRARTAELQITNIELARASRLKDEFLASMSHELRTPLTGVLNLSEVLQEQVYGELNQKQLKALMTIEESGRHLLALINDILDLSKIEAGQLTLQFERFTVNDVCLGSLQMVKGMAQKKNIAVHFSIQPISIELYADPRRMKQILVNLLSNAIKFTQENGEVGLEVVGNPEAQNVTFAVWDTGAGIAAEDFSKLFHPFTQLDSSLARQQSGTGLGLALVQRMTDLHGGSVSLESTPGKGSRFTVLLPWQSGDDNLLEAKHISGEQTVKFQFPVSTGAKPSILLVDDNQTNLEVYSDYLISCGYKVDRAYNGQEAIQMAQVLAPDLILMDIQLPGMDGLEAIRRIRNLAGSLAVTPILALTALAMPGDRQICLNAGANEYLSKPVSLHKLTAVIYEQLTRKRVISLEPE